MRRLFAVLLPLLLLPALAVPAAADPGPNVVFLGDSVTAGFGYLGSSENAPNVSGPVNSSFANAWYFGDNSLSDCSPISGTPDDRCSNNNVAGAPWNAGAWQPGPKAPMVSYSYQIAANQNPVNAAAVQNWAITGSTPAQWDNGGAFNPQLQKIKNSYVVMTLGANPILASFMQIKLAGSTQTNGACADSTMWLGWTGWWAYPTSNVVDCANQQWALNQQSEHLASVYQTLLGNGNRVLALRYYRGCMWSFGNWQPNGNIIDGPAAGNSCPSQKAKVSACSKCSVDGSTTQWAQAKAAQDAINDNIAAAVGEAQQWAKDNNINPANLQIATPDQSAWADHQAWSGASWVFMNDTWIHPSVAGHAQLAGTVTAAMCSAFGQWCGSQPTWDPTPEVADATLAQVLRGTVPARLTNRSYTDLPNMTKQGNAVGWDSLTPRVCKVYHGGVTTTRQDGKCRLVAEAVRSGREQRLRERHVLTVR